MWPAHLATTFPSPRPVEPPLTLLEWAGVTWFAWLFVFVIALVWVLARRRHSTSRLQTLTFNLLAGLSLALFAAMTVLIVSEYEGALHPLGWPEKPITQARPYASVQDGRMYMGVMTPVKRSAYASRVRYDFGYMHVPASTQTQGRFVQVGEVWQLIAPWWAVLVLTAVAPTVWVLRATVTNRTHRFGFCAGCGYDLRGTPDRCPECGTITRAASDSKTEGT